MLRLSVLTVASAVSTMCVGSHGEKRARRRGAPAKWIGRALPSRGITWSESTTCLPVAIRAAANDSRFPRPSQWFLFEETGVLLLQLSEFRFRRDLARMRLSEGSDAYASGALIAI